MNGRFNSLNPGMAWFDPQTGKPTPEFFRFIHDLWNRTGGPDDAVQYLQKVQSRPDRGISDPLYYQQQGPSREERGVEDLRQFVNGLRQSQLEDKGIAELREQIAAFGGNLEPVGKIVACQWRPAYQYLEAAGQTVSRTTYPDLWAEASSVAVAEGTKKAGQFGNGNGSTTFSLPDLQGLVLAGKDSATFGTLGDVVGTETHTLTTAELPAHNHPGTGHTHSYDDGTNTYTLNTTTTGITAGTDADVIATASLTPGSTDTARTTGSQSVTTNDTGIGDPHNIIQPTAVIRWWIRVLE